MTTETVQAEASRLILDTTKGQIEIELKPDLAPNHVARISELAAEGFYDGIIFTASFQALWPKPETQQEQGWAVLVKSWRQNSPITLM